MMRTTIPTVIHVDGTTRPQLVKRKHNDDLEVDRIEEVGPLRVPMQSSIDISTLNGSQS